MEDKWVIRAVTALKLAASWFFLSVMAHSWYTDKIARGGTWRHATLLGIWSGETASRERNQVPVTLYLVIEIKPDYTYALKHRAFAAFLEASSNNYQETGFWEVEEGRLRTAPKVCKTILNVEWPRMERVPCRGGDSWSLDLTKEGIWKVEEIFGETAHTVPLQKL